MPKRTRNRGRGKRRNDSSYAEPTKARIIGESYLSYACDMMHGYGTNEQGDYDVISDVDPRLSKAATQINDVMADMGNDDDATVSTKIRNALHDTYIPRRSLDETSARQQDVARMCMHVSYMMFLQSMKAQKVRQGQPSAPWM